VRLAGNRRIVLGARKPGFVRDRAALVRIAPPASSSVAGPEYSASAGSRRRSSSGSTADAGIPPTSSITRKRSIALSPRAITPSAEISSTPNLSSQVLQSSRAARAYATSRASSWAWRKIRDSAADCPRPGLPTS
jgi:hypothetical protein